MRVGLFIDLFEAEQAVGEMKAAIPSYVNVHCFTAQQRAETRKVMEWTLDQTLSALQKLTTFSGIAEKDLPIDILRIDKR